MELSPQAKARVDNMCNMNPTIEAYIRDFPLLNSKDDPTKYERLIQQFSTRTEDNLSNRLDVVLTPLMYVEDQRVHAAITLSIYIL